MRRAKIVAGLVVVAMLLIAWRLGFFHSFGDPAALREELLRLGPWGYLAFVVAYTLLQPFGLPGLGFVAAASLIWPWPVAFALSMTGSMTATAFGFVFARFIARDWVAKKLPPRFQKYDARLAERAFSTIFLLRLMFLMQPLLHAYFGLSKVRFSTYMIASTAAYAGPIFVVSYFGQRALDYVSNAPIGHKIVAAVIFVKLIAVVFFAMRYWRRKQRRELADVVVTE
jgi:uncharacterized membrane protein YdjX (TVP38/TMEM64 family)